ncbi:unnamed protein product [Gadus morhua 'NCC']
MALVSGESHPAWLGAGEEREGDIWVAKTLRRAHSSTGGPVPGRGDRGRDYVSPCSAVFSGVLLAPRYGAFPSQLTSNYILSSKLTSMKRLAMTRLRRNSAFRFQQKIHMATTSPRSPSMMPKSIQELSSYLFPN